MNYRATICMIAMMLTGNVLGLIESAHCGIGSYVLGMSHGSIAAFGGILGGASALYLNCKNIQDKVAQDKAIRVCKTDDDIVFYERLAVCKEQLRYKFSEGQFLDRIDHWFSNRCGFVFMKESPFKGNCDSWVARHSNGGGYEMIAEQQQYEGFS